MGGNYSGEVTIRTLTIETQLHPSSKIDETTASSTGRSHE
jgi:hypothetical protein